MRNNGERVAFLVAAGLALAALVGMIVVVLGMLRDNNGAARLPFATTQSALPPFGDFHEARVAVGGRCLRVLVASTGPQRTAGLRDVAELSPYDGMLFVYPADTDTKYTMATTLLPLDITWYDAQGNPVDNTQMTPCPHGTDATCPTYASRQKYRYALERVTGGSAASASGSVGACA